MPTTDPAERMRAVREHMAREGAKMPTVDHNGYGPGHRPGWHVPEDAPNLTGGPTDHINDQSMIVDNSGPAQPTEDTPAAAPAATRTGPMPDMSQGAHGTGIEPSVDQQIADAQQRGDWRTVLSLQHRKHGADRPPSGRNNPYWNGPSAA